MDEVDSIILSVLKLRMNKTRFNKKSITVGEVVNLCNSAQSTLSKDPFLLKLNGDFVVCGDIHGSVDDLIRIFHHFGYPPKSNYLFLGDYVDRGYASIEVLLLLFSLKIKFPQNIYLLRGNHECHQVCSIYGFQAECFRKLNKQCYNKFLECFQQLSIAAIINNKIICLHGGISPQIKKLSVLEELKKPRNIPDSGPIADILWSDPDRSVKKYTPSERGVGYLFGFEPLIEFLDNNDLQNLIRSHEVCERGFEYPFLVHNSGNESQQKRLLTIFSSCNYCGDRNDGAVANVVNQDINIVTFKSLSKNESKKFRVIIPDFLLDKSNPKKKPEFDEN